uniref:Uncharacterized protein LOC114343674 n=1 Tax=Diabrotica virgifera virgifera TaxID=50390 RepID=A0A6P7H2Q6_DIAVI
MIKIFLIFLNVKICVTMIICTIGIFVLESNSLEPRPSTSKQELISYSSELASDEEGDNDLFGSDDSIADNTYMPNPSDTDSDSDMQIKQKVRRNDNKEKCDNILQADNKGIALHEDAYESEPPAKRKRGRKIIKGDTREVRKIRKSTKNSGNSYTTKTGRIARGRKSEKLMNCRKCCSTKVDEETQ